MITVSVTSDSSLPELHIARRSIIEMIESRVNDKLDFAQQAIKISNEVGAFTEPTFNATELAEAETLGKPVCSTVDAEASKIAPEDTQVNTSIPTPQSVFAQPAQTTENAANPVAPVTESPATDADGLVWDERIHSSSKEFNKDGTWRKRRGVDAQLVTTVEAELRGARGEAPAPIVGVSVPTPPPLVVDATGKLVPESTEPRVPDPTPSVPMTFPELLDGVTKAMVAGQLTQARITEALKSIGIEALPHLIARTDLIPAFRNALGGVV